MCGIAGVLSRASHPAVPATAISLTAGLRHRGPDGEAFWADTGAPGGRLGQDRIPPTASLILGHRRLSIVDLATGDQPMANEDGAVWVAFNGEIFNHRELRETLIAVGHRFRTQADTEVLVHGWEEWGTDLLPRLNGIFALALTDRRQGVTLLARDPIGVKPLYVGIHEGLTWWASELGAARRAGVLDGSLSPEGLKLYLLFRFIPAPQSIFASAWKLPPSHYVLLRAEDAGRQPRWQPFQTRIRSSMGPRTPEDWRAALLAELDAAVTRQLMSDVPVGSLLSGGVDSSVVTSVMSHALPYAPHAFGIGFRSHGDRSEVLAAQRAADALRVPFTPTWVNDADYLAGWPEAFALMSEPIGNSGGLLVHLLCRTVGRTHKVVLSGQGADEPLGGYPRHMAERLRRVGRLAPGVSSWVADRVIGAGAGHRLERVLSARDALDRYLEILAVLDPETVDAMVPYGPAARELGRTSIRRWIPEEASGDSLNDLLRVDARLSLADDLLTVADHFSMRASVELRVPFLDLAFLDLAERMPSRYKVSMFGERKWLYRQAAIRSLPPSVARIVGGVRGRVGPKMGFTAPLARWFSDGDGTLGPLAHWLEPLLARGVLVREATTKLLADRSPSERQRELLSLYALSQWVAARN